MGPTSYRERLLTLDVVLGVISLYANLTSVVRYRPFLDDRGRETWLR